ncbi:hypothetical protein [Promicromonospora panici]|uniref:hypothetical protein n=1 Tax=Promicromonospora panici TaxID=2219658 RepID=UPI00101D342D|nr:hypothetical protein [Promicromonospora panici]
MRSGVRMARVVGLALGALVAVARRWRPRPLHPTGVVLAGTLRLESHDAPGGAALGAPVVHPVVVRVSRAAGLPTSLPDVFGLAVHWTAGDRSQDLLLSATGLGRATRFLLAPRLRPLAGGFGTLMPFRDTDGRPVLLAAAPTEPSPRARSGTGTGPSALVGAELRLLSAHPGGRWHRLGTLRCGATTMTDAPRLDPVQNVPGALGTYPWTAALRAPAYRAARSGHPRGDVGGAV